MTQERLAQLLQAAGNGELTPVETELLNSFTAMRKLIVRSIDRHPILVRDWDLDGQPKVSPCGCTDCFAIRKAAIGITE